MASDSLELMVFTPFWGLPSTSAFCIKLDAWLRMVGIPYTAVSEDDVRKAPKKKNPWIRIGDLEMGDSGLIIEYLKRRYGVDPDAGLSARDRATALAAQRMLEEHYYWALVHTLFVDDTGWALYREVFAAMPLPLRWIVPSIVRGEVRKAAHGHGMGRHTPDEMMDMGRSDLDALAELLGERAYVFGDHPTTIDASAYGMLALTLWSPVDSPLKQHIQSSARLTAYATRLRTHLYGVGSTPAADDAVGPPQRAQANA